MINRSAMVVRPAQPYIDWALGLDDSGMSPSSQDEGTFYLISDEDLEDHEEKVLRKVFS